MKKFNLAIPKPCHENWEQMTKEEKGRFCGSCQKTVIDFTNMSDRELADFFKKPVGSVCGRFQQDQLNRVITVPKKPIPWLRHFIHIAWPAFILMLKSCGPKVNVSNGIDNRISLLNAASKGVVDAEMMGAVITPLSKEDTIPPPPTMGKVEPTKEWFEPVQIVGDIAITLVEEEKMDTVSHAMPIEETTPDFIPLDTVTVTSFATISCSRTTMGLVSEVKAEQIQSDPIESKVKETTIQAYPNPIRAGHMLNLKFAANKDAPVSVQLLTVNGQRVLHKLLSETANTTITSISLPANLSAGIYFIQAVYPNGTTIQSRVVVSH